MLIAVSDLKIEMIGDQPFITATVLTGDDLDRLQLMQVERGEIEVTAERMFRLVYGRTPDGMETLATMVGLQDRIIEYLVVYRHDR